MKNRRSLTPSTDSAGDGARDVHATRRGGARHEISARVTLAPAGRADGGAAPLEGWALNVSRGGVRVIVDGKVEPGAEFEITMTQGSGSDATTTRRSGRIVWVQDEPDGTIAGIEFRAGAPPADGAPRADGAPPKA